METGSIESIKQSFIGALGEFAASELKEVSEIIGGELQRRKSSELDAVVQHIKQVAADYNIQLEQVIDAALAGQKHHPNKIQDKKPGNGETYAKFQNPDNPNQVWSGRGKRPAWVHEALAAGKSLSDLMQVSIPIAA